jgi:hypothetical protein
MSSSWQAAVEVNLVIDIADQDSFAVAYRPGWSFHPRRERDPTKRLCRAQRASADSARPSAPVSRCLYYADDKNADSD